MNILLISHFFPPHVGGVETASYNTMKILAELGHNVIVLTCKDKFNSVKFEKDTNSLIYRYKSYYPPEIKGFTQSSNFGLMPKAIFKLPKIIKRHNIQLIHAQGRFFSISFLTAILNRLIFKKPMVITAQGRLRGGITRYIEIIFDSTISRFIYQKINKIICVSNSLMKYLISLKIRKNNLTVIPNGVDVNLFNKRESNVLNEYIEDKKDFKKVLFAGRLDRQKGVEFLIKAIPKVVKYYKKTHFFILGNGILEVKLKNLVKKLKIESYVTFIDMVPVEKMPEYYSAVDIFCLPSIHEGFPLSIVEALSIGLVIVTSDTEGIPEVIIEGKSGFLVKPGDISHLSEKILKVLNLSPQEFSRISRNNINLAKEKYSWKIIVKEILDVYMSCFRKKPN